MPSFMEMALAEARAAGERGEVPVGCVLVRDGEVIARAGNRTIIDRDPTAHAEMIAIRQTARAPGGARRPAVPPASPAPPAPAPGPPAPRGSRPPTHRTTPRHRPHGTGI